MLSHREVMEKQFLFPRHECGGLVRYEIDPPGKGTNGFVNLEVGQLKIAPQNEWTFLEYEIKYCPYCGERLPTNK